MYAIWESYRDMGKLLRYGSDIEIRKSYKDTIFESIKHFVPQKILSKNPDPEYYNKEVKRLKVKARKMHSKRKFGQHYQADLNDYPKIYWLEGGGWGGG
jgi:hypothetical protein